MKQTVSILLLLISTTSFSQTNVYNALMKEGNRSYAKGNYIDAFELFMKAKEKAINAQQIKIVDGKIKQSRRSIINQQEDLREALKDSKKLLISVKKEKEKVEKEKQKTDSANAVSDSLLKVTLRQTESNRLTLLANKISKTNSTISLRLLEGALSFDIDNKNALDTYYSLIRNERFYKSQVNHPSFVFSGKLSPVDDSFVTGASDGIIRLWSKKGVLLETFIGHKEPVNLIDFSPDGTKFVSSSYDGTIRIWDLTKKTSAVIFKTTGIMHVDYSPNGQFIIFGGNDKNMVLWDTKKNKGKELIYMKQSITALKVSSNSKSIIVGDLEGTLVLFKSTGKKIWEKNMKNIVSSVNFSNNNDKIIVGFRDGTVNILNLDGNSILTISEKKGPITSVFFSDNDNNFAACGYDNYLTTWNLEGKKVQVFKGHGSVVSFAEIDEIRNRLLTGSWDNTAKLWDWRKESYLIWQKELHEDLISNIKFFPKDKAILSVGWDGMINKIGIYDGSIILSENLQHGCRQITNVLIEENNQFIWLVNSSSRWINAYDNKLKKNANLSWVSPKYGITYSIDLDQDRNLVLIDEGKYAILHQLLTNTNVAFEHSSQVTAVKFLKRKNLIITGTENGKVILWKKNGKIFKKLDGHTQRIYSISLSPNGNYFLTSSFDGSVIVWSSEGVKMKTFSSSYPLCEATFSPSGNEILAGGQFGTVIMWDLEGNQIYLFNDQKGVVYSVAYSPDGNYIATGNSDGIVTLYANPVANNLEGAKYSLGPSELHQYDLPYSNMETSGLKSLDSLRHFALGLLINSENAENYQQKTSLLLEAIKIYRTILEVANNEFYKIELSIIYSELANVYIHNKKIHLAIKASKKGLETYKESKLSKRYLILSYFIKQEFILASSIYDECKFSEYSFLGGTYKEVLLNDIEELKDKGVITNQAYKIVINKL